MLFLASIFSYLPGRFPKPISSRAALEAFASKISGEDDISVVYELEYHLDDLVFGTIVLYEQLDELEQGRFDRPALIELR